MKEKRLLEPQKITAGLISGTKGAHAPKSLVWVAPNDKLADALAKMNDLGLDSNCRCSTKDVRWDRCAKIVRCLKL